MLGSGRHGLRRRHGSPRPQGQSPSAAVLAAATKARRSRHSRTIGTAARVAAAVASVPLYLSFHTAMFAAMIRSATQPLRPALQQPRRWLMVLHSRLGRDYQHRWAMMKNLVTSLIEHERIKTTEARAKELRRVSDRMVTHAKRGSLAARREAAKIVKTKPCITKLFTILAERYRDRQGGYTRVLKTYPRMGDGAKMAYVEMVDRPMKRMPMPLPEQHPSVYPGRGGRKYRAGKRDLRNERWKPLLD